MAGGGAAGRAGACLHGGEDLGVPGDEEAGDGVRLLLQVRPQLLAGLGRLRAAARRQTLTIAAMPVLPRQRQVTDLRPCLATSALMSFETCD